MTTKISMNDLHEKHKMLISNPNAIIVDVRTPEEFAEGHVPGSKNFPVDGIAHHVNEIKKFKEIYIYCRSGGRVGVATKILESAGLTDLHSVLAGGFPNWEDSGFEVEL